LQSFLSAALIPGQPIFEPFNERFMVFCPKTAVHPYFSVKKAKNLCAMCCAMRRLTADFLFDSPIF
jgi:hypothetical protein